MVLTSGRPRTSTEPPSPASRLICTPVTRCRASVMVTSGNLPMLSAVMLSWMLAASRLSSIARICEARTPTTVISDKVVTSSPCGVLPGTALSFAALSFAACAGPDAGADCVVVCAGRFAAGLSACGDAAADVAATANSDAEMASANGLLRCTMDMTLYPSMFICRVRPGFPLEHLQPGSDPRRCLQNAGLHQPALRIDRLINMLRHALRTPSIFRRRQRDIGDGPLPLRRVAGRDDAQRPRTGVALRRNIRRQCRVTARNRRACQRQRGQYRTLAIIDMDFE